MHKQIRRGKNDVRREGAHPVTSRNEHENACHRQPQGGGQGALAPPPLSSPSYGAPLPPLHPLKLCSNYNNAKRLQHVTAIVSVIELLTLACMYN